MNKLDKYTTDQLIKELDKRKELELFNKWNKIPKGVLGTETIREGFDGTTLYMCHVDDGLESVPCFVEAKVNEHSPDSIKDIVQKRYIEDSGGEDNMVLGGMPMIDDITIEEVGRYGYCLLKINPIK